MPSEKLKKKKQIFMLTDLACGGNPLNLTDNPSTHNFLQVYNIKCPIFTLDKDGNR